MELVYIGLVNSPMQFLSQTYGLTIGFKYQVADFRYDLYLLDDDYGLTIPIYKTCFMSVEDFRDIKIDMIVNE